jgi:transcriptional regulator with XRE-family HTH domain
MTTAHLEQTATSAPATGFTVLHVANDDDAILDPAAANAPDHGRLAVRVRPGMRRTDWLTRDLLAALGVDFTVSGSGRNADENLQLLPVRLTAQRINDLLVTGAETLTPAILTDLVLLAAAAGTRLWLVTAPPVTADLVTTLNDWCPTEVTVTEAGRVWPGLLPSSGGTPAGSTATAPAAGPAVDTAEPRRLPLVDATTLLAASRRLLTPAEADWVHRRLADAVTDAGHQFDTATATATATDPAGTTDAVAAWLLSRYDAAGTLTQFLCDVRGLQVAGLWRGVLIQVDIPALLGTASAAPSAAARTPEVWQRLRAYRLPVRGAVCALAAARLGAAAICALTLADVAPDGSTVTLNGSTVPIEPDAAGYLAEQRLLRLATGAPAHAPLLTTSTGTQLSGQGLARLLSEARTEVGVVVTSRVVERQAPGGATTLRRWGVTITEIGPAVPGAPDTTTTTAPATRANTSLASPADQPLLDVELLRRRKLELRLSRNDIAKHLGVSTAVIGRLESGANHAEQPLGLLLRLAALLGVDLADLLPRHRAPAAQPAVPAGPSAEHGNDAADVRLVGAALHTLDVLVPTETLADVLGWTADRLAAAVDGLDLAAPAVGLRVHRLKGRVSLIRAADALPAEALAAVLRHDAARTGLDPTQARLVHAALTRAIAPPDDRGGHHLLARSNAEKVAAGSLAGAGVLTTDDAGDLRLTGDTAVSLLVPAPPRAALAVPIDAHAATNHTQEEQ